MAKNKESNSNVELKTSLCWLIILLVIMVVFLLTIKIDKIPNGEVLVTYISNFSTMLSIILSISSIFFAYYTSRDTSMQYRSMEKALEEVRITNRSITENNSLLLSQVREIAINVNVLNDKLGRQTAQIDNKHLDSPNLQLKSNERNNVTKSNVTNE